MSNVNTGHNPVITADTGNTATLCRATTEGTHFTNRIVVTDDEFCIFTRVLFVLRLFTNGCELENMIVFTDGCATGYDGMWTYTCAGIDTHLGIYDGESTDLDVIGVSANTICFDRCTLPLLQATRASGFRGKLVLGGSIQEIRRRGPAPFHPHIQGLPSTEGKPPVILVQLP